MEQQLKTLNFILIITPTMISIKTLVFCFVICFSLAQNDPKQLLTEGDVIILNNKNFGQAVLESEDAWMVDFYAPWCGHCIKMSAQWDKFGTKMKGSIKVAKIDASENSIFNDAYGLKGFPHIVFIPAGKKDQSIYFTHTGTRTAQGFEKWVLQKQDEIKRSQLERLTDEQKWTETCLGPHSDFCTIFFLPNFADSSEEEHQFYIKTIQGLTKKFSRQPISWLWTKDGDHRGLQQLFGLQKSFPYIVLVNPTGRRFAVMQKSFTEDDFTEWLKNVWDIDFKSYEGKLPFGDQMPLPLTSQTPEQL